MATSDLKAVDVNHDAFKQSRNEVSDRLERMLKINGSKTVDEIHRELGAIMWEYVGMSRNEAGLKSSGNKFQNFEKSFGKTLK